MPIRRLIRCIVLLGCCHFAGFDYGLCAQNTIPPGIIIPVVLHTSIDSQKSRADQAIVARVAQDIPLGGKQVIPRSSKVFGEIAETKSNSGQATLSLRFDRIALRHVQITIATQLRAVASFMVIQDAETPTDTPHDRLNSPYARTTIQIGGDAVYRGGGPVQSRTGEIVGTPTNPWGVLDRVTSTPGPQCTGAVADDTRPQAMWVFSADACGVYGFSGLRFQNGSTVSRDGQVFFSAEKRIKLPSGTGLLLTVTGTQTGAGK
jgi:hypothetical protein